MAATPSASGPVEQAVASSPTPATANNVRVVCRLRPMSEREKRAGTVPAVTASTERREVAVVRMLGGGTGGGARQVRSTFHFDNVFTSFSTQEDIFAATLRPLVAEVLMGYEATAFAYGQTGTGKTYTMEGDLASEEGRGLVPRVAEELIEALSGEGFSDYSLQVSYLEIYNEELSDLLDAGEKRLELKETGRGVRCVGLSEVPARSVAEILELVRAAQDRRRVAETRINARSSRSHCIFTMKVRCRRRASGGGELENVGKLHLVDLAGSECAGKASMSNGDGAAASQQPSHLVQAKAAEEERERRSINQSLLTLGRVIAALRAGGAGGHSQRVPYRDSKLTRLLQDALGGRSKTVVIATVSPALIAAEETISTLNYAEQASSIKNKPVANSLYKTARLPTAGGNSEAAARAAQMDWAELEMKVSYLTSEVEEAQSALAKKYLEAQELSDQLEAAREARDVAVAELEGTQKKLSDTRVVQAGTAQDADRLAAAAQRLDAARAAAAEHIAALAAYADARRAEVLAARMQGRELCDSLDASAASFATHNDAAASAAQETAQKLLAAHSEGAAAGERAAAAQAEVVGSLASSVRSHVASGDASLAAALAGGEEPRDGGAAAPARLRQAMQSLGSSAGSHEFQLDSHAVSLRADVQAAAERREHLQRVLGDAATAHTAAAQERQKALRVELKALAAAEADHGKLAAVTLDAMLSGIKGQVDALRAQREKEEELLASLSEQKTSLQSEVATIRRTLEEARAELGTTRSRQSSLLEAQEVGRRKLFEKLTGMLETELGALGQELSDGAASVSTSLDAVEKLAKAADDAVVGAEARSSATCGRAERTAGAWGEACRGSAEALQNLHATDGTRAGEQLAAYREEVSTRRRGVSTQVDASEADARRHGEELQRCSTLSREMGEAEQQALQARVAGAAESHGAARKLGEDLGGANAAAELLLQAVGSHRIALAELGKSGETSEKAATAAREEGLKAQAAALEIARGTNAQLLEEISALRVRAGEAVAAQGTAARRCLAAPPLAAFDNGGRDEAPPMAPKEATERPDVDIAPRRSEEQLLRTAGSTAPMSPWNGKENDTTPAVSPAANVQVSNRKASPARFQSGNVSKFGWRGADVSKESSREAPALRENTRAEQLEMTKAPWGA